MINVRVDEENGKYLVTVKGRAWKVHIFSSNEFLKKIGCLILSPTFGIRG